MFWTFEFEDRTSPVPPPLTGFVFYGPLAIASAVLGGAGAGISAASTLAAGKSAQQMGQFQQQEYTQQAETATATGQRAMLESQRTTGLVQSRLQAAAGASGGSATSGSVLNLSRDIGARGEYNALMQLSQGENQAAGLTNMGDAAAYEGNLKNSMAPLSAIGTLANGASSAFQTLSYGKGMPMYPQPYG